jgi:LysR family transcriptional regulator, transcriptional activator of nhaA
MDRINYQHLFYFWNVAREGSVTRASEKLYLAQPTISAQLSAFEKALDEKLFYRQGRNLTLTETGRIVFNYAEEIFSLGRELSNTLKGHASGQSLRLSVGVADALPKLIAYRLIEPAFNIAERVQLLCYEDKAERLITEISQRNIDIVLSDTPATAASGNRAFNHPLGESGVTVFAVTELAERYHQNFPQSLRGAPFLLPTRNTALRRSLDQWFETANIYPKILAEIEDSALLKTFGSGGSALFVAPTVVSEEIKQEYKVTEIGEIDGVKECFYAITVPRKLKHPAITAILENAQQRLFDPG